MRLFLVAVLSLFALACDKTIHEVRLDLTPQHMDDSALAAQSQAHHAS